MADTSDIDRHKQGYEAFLAGDHDILTQMNGPETV